MCSGMLIIASCRGKPMHISIQRTTTKLDIDDDAHCHSELGSSWALSCLAPRARLHHSVPFREHCGAASGINMGR